MLTGLNNIFENMARLIQIVIVMQVWGMSLLIATIAKVIAA